MKSFLAHWKTTVNGFLAFAIVTLTTISGFLGTLNLTTSPTPGVKSIHISTWVVLSVNLALGLCRAWVGMLQLDAGTVPAIVPGQPGIQSVPAHEIPDDPNATPVIKP